MFCHKCGTENDEGSRYCHTCGENISPEDAVMLDSGTLVPAPGESIRPLKKAPEDLTLPVDRTTSPVSNGKAAPMKFFTRVAYNILESDRKAVALFLVLLITVAAGIFAVTSCLGLVSSFAELSDASRALPSGIQSEEIQSGIDGAWGRIWRNLAFIPLSFLVFFIGIRLLVRIRRVSETLRKIRKEYN